MKQSKIKSKNFYKFALKEARKGIKELEKFRCNGKTDLVDLRTILIERLRKIIEFSKGFTCCNDCLITEQLLDLGIKQSLAYRKRKRRKS